MRTLVFSVAAIAACGSSASTTSGSESEAEAEAESEGAACDQAARACADVEAAFAGQAGVTVTCHDGDDTFTVEASGVPPYASNQTTPNAITAQNWTATLPLRPACAATMTDVRQSRGPIGLMVNGVAFFGPADAQGRDAVMNEGPTFDDCGGHAAPGCVYHYHEASPCVLGMGVDVASRDDADGHGPIVGFALDGFALHGADVAAGEPPLDACNGHFDAQRAYHYHVTGGYPYLIGCDRGAPTGTLRAAPDACSTGGGMAPPGR